MISFFIPGIPAPQGSKRHVGNGRLIESSKLLPAWREAVRIAAQQAAGDNPPIDAPVHVTARFDPKHKRLYAATRDGKTRPGVTRKMNVQVAQKLDHRIKLTEIQDGYAEVSLRESRNPSQYERSCFVFVHRVSINSETIVRKDGTTWETPEVDGWAQGLTGCPNSIAGNIYPTRAMAANSVIDQLLRMERKMYANE